MAGLGGAIRGSLSMQGAGMGQGMGMGQGIGNGHGMGQGMGTGGMEGGDAEYESMNVDAFLESLGLP